MGKKHCAFCWLSVMDIDSVRNELHKAHYVISKSQLPILGYKK